jgi:hypothetical protein
VPLAAGLGAAVGQHAQELDLVAVEEGFFIPQAAFPMPSPQRQLQAAHIPAAPQSAATRSGCI